MKFSTTIRNMEPYCIKWSNFCIVKNMLTTWYFIMGDSRTCYTFFNGYVLAMKLIHAKCGSVLVDNPENYWLDIDSEVHIICQASWGLHSWWYGGSSRECLLSWTVTVEGSLKNLK